MEGEWFYGMFWLLELLTLAQGMGTGWGGLGRQDAEQLGRVTLGSW